MKLGSSVGCCMLALLAISISGCSPSTEQPQDLSRVVALRPTTQLKINPIRLTAIKQTARSMGAQAGLAWRAKQLNRVLIGQKYKLTQIFNFNYLVLEHNVLPPVLQEGRNTLNLADDKTIRIADIEYQIVYPPRFVTAPPTWRDYIWMNYKKPEFPNNTLLPKTSQESKIWNQYVKIGWNDGVIQADEIFIANLNRLTRDLNGMILYRKLLAQNMVSAPFVSQADLGITGGGDDMRINDKVLRITAISELKPNNKKWKPVMPETPEDEDAEDTNTSVIGPINHNDKI